MTLFESGESSGEVSLTDLFAGKDPTGAHPALLQSPCIRFPAVEKPSDAAGFFSIGVSATKGK